MREAIFHENENVEIYSLPKGAVRVKRRIWPLLILLILIHLSTVLYTIPLNRVIELRLCQSHYSTANPPEKLCKIDEIQRQLAWIQGIMETTLVVCDLVVTVPFGFVAERWGVRVVLWCNLVPRVFMSVWAVVIGHFDHILPTKSIIAGPFLAVLGGECVLQSTVWAMTAALVNNDYIYRAKYFSYLSSTSYVVSFVGPTLASFTMSRNLWAPFYINIVLLALAVPVVMLLPDNELLPVKSGVTRAGNDAEEADPLLSQSEDVPNHYSNAFETQPGILQRIRTTVRKLVRLVVGRPNFQILLCSFFLTALASSDTKLLVQYISKRYEWTFAQAGYMLSAKAIVNFTLLAIVVPRIVKFSISSKAVHSSEVRLNVLGAQISILISVVGVVCVALAFKFWMMLVALMIYALGSALPVFTMSLVKSPLIALAHSDIQDFSIVMLTKTLGSLVGTPFMTVLWVQAIRLGGVGLGLPYFVSGVSTVSITRAIANS
ncbi:hypothetical protein EK21DRAFT_65893 [Setomelanomma holmii]|uniref:MFS transporter n=1 Tax=Setomelanomma holmii TaxID=210430 RepID=A0A9P4HA39_9PLEO|nr:hypothetical protein EK21DRAFT_65893 [Setomelanomma holmii]